MRFAVLGDIQGNAVALQTVLDMLTTDHPGLDGVVCAGDVVGYGPQPNEVIELLRSQSVSTVLGNYDDAVAFSRIGSGRDFPDVASELADMEAIRWTRETLSQVNSAWLRDLPRDLRIGAGAGGLAVKGDALDERAREYRRTFFLRAFMGGAFRTPVSSAKRVLMTHGSPRALNEYVRPDTAQSILHVIVRDAQSDVVISGHAATSFRRETEGVVFIGVGPVNGVEQAEVALVDVSSDVEVEFKRVDIDRPAQLSALERSNLPETLVQQALSKLSPAPGDQAPFTG